MWMIRNPGGQHADELLKRSIVGIGYGEASGQLGKAKTPDDFYAIVKKSFPDYTGQQVVNAGRQLYKFVHEVKEGDEVITYDSPLRVYHVGVVSGPVDSDASLPEHLANFRPVKWKKDVERDKLSKAARNSLGSTLTIFKPAEEAVREIKALMEGKAKSLPAPDEVAPVEVEDPFANAQENSKELIKDKLMRLDWDEMQHLVAGILRAMGYKTRVTPAGSDRGRDIIASPDGLGLEHPRIFVEVKHRKGTMGAPEVRKFMGGRDPQNDRCLYVSTGGFTNEARYEAERAKFPLTLVDADMLVELLVEHYDEVDTETRTLVPLRKTYWPA